MSVLPRLGTIVARGLGALSALCFRRAPAVGVLLLLVTLAFVRLAASLGLNADLTQLLPESFESVRDVKKLTEEFGGVGYVSLVVRGDDEAELVRFAEDLAPKLAALPTVKYVDYKRPVPFFRDHALYYMQEADLEAIRDRLQNRVDWEVSRATGALLDEDEAPPAVDFSDLRKKYEDRLEVDGRRRRSGAEGTRRDEYYLDEQGTSLAILVKPTKLASDFSFAQKVVSDVEGVLAEIDRSAYGGGIEVTPTGRYKKRVDLQNTLARDVQLASALAGVLVLAYVVFHFRRASAVILLFVPLAVSLTVTYGFAALVFGSLNILTSFIGAILLGLALDSGIHLLGRYDEERSAGRSPEEAIRRGFGEAGRASLAAVSTNIGAFLCLLLADFKAFREFGVLAAGGMLFTLLAYMTVLPVLLGLGARIFKNTSPAEAPPLRIARPLLRWAPAIFYGMALLVAIAVIRLPTARFNYDFAALDDVALPSFRLDKEVNRLIGRSQTPLVVLPSSDAAAEEIAAQLRQRKQRNGEQSTIDRVVTLTDLVPKNQDAKRELLEEIAEVAGRLRENYLDENQKKQRDELIRMAKASPFTREDLPAEIKRQFHRAGTEALASFVLVYPRVSMSDGRQAERVAEEVRDIVLRDGTSVRASGEPMVLADILTSMKKDLPVVFALALTQQLLLLWLLMGSFGRAMLTIFPALVTMPLLIGFVSLFGLEFNYLNVMLLPTLLGMGEDGGAHLVARVGDGEPLEIALGHTARATFGAGLTTLFGFGTMIVATHPGLRLFGQVAVLGIALNLVVCIFFLPSFMALLDTARQRRKRTSIPAPPSYKGEGAEG